MSVFSEFLRAFERIDEKQAEQCDFLVCVRATAPAYFDDDEIGTCHRCGEAVRFRPHAPKAPLRLCMECFAEKAQEQ